MKELRNHGDEAARILQAHLQDGVEPPAGLARHFEDFMRMVKLMRLQLIRTTNQDLHPTTMCENVVYRCKAIFGLKINIFKPV